VKGVISGNVFTMHQDCPASRKRMAETLREVADLIEVGAPLVAGGIVFGSEGGKGTVQMKANIILRYRPSEH
jgi:hypothetical protein